MGWTNLFKANSIEQTLMKRKKGVFHVDPMLTGQNLRNVIKVFRMVELPFVWKEKEILRENNPNSPFHKMPKSVFKKERAHLERVLKLRNGIAAAKEKELKFRQESLNKRPYKGFNDLLKKNLPFLLKPQRFNLDAEVRVKKSSKMVSDFVKEVPKVKSNQFGRKGQEKVKNLMEDKIVDSGFILSINKNVQRERQIEKDQRVKEDEKKKADEKTKKYAEIQDKANKEFDKSTSTTSTTTSKTVNNEKKNNKDNSSSSGDDD
jgi:hypothetical protein